MRAKLGLVWSLAKRRPLVTMLALLLTTLASLVGVESCSARSKRRVSGGTTGAPTDDRPGSFDTGLSAGDVHRNLSKGYGERVAGVEDDVTKIRRQVEGLEKNLAALTKQNDEKEKLIRDLTDALKGLQGRNDPVTRVENPASVPSRIRKFETLSTENAEEKRMVHIPAGSFGEATLLSGVYAPTSGEPLPVLIKLDAAMIGPSKTRVPLKDVFIIGKARGDANSSRATIQLDTLSLVKENGEAIEAPVNGWVVDADGIQGVRGQYVWRADEILTLTSVASGASTFAKTFAAKETTQQFTPLGGVTSTLTGDAAKFAGLQAISGMSDRIAELVSARMQEIQPAVYAANGGKITVAFISGVTLQGFQVEELSHESDRRPYRGLDAHR